MFELNYRSNSRHNLARVFHVHLAKPTPDNVVIFVFANLHLLPTASHIIPYSKINEIFVVNFYEGSLDAVVPSSAVFFFELSCVRINCGNRPWDDIHVIARIRGVSIQIHVSHGTLLVCLHARIAQLKPSMKREIRGCTVEVNMAYCVVEGPTWSKEKSCFFDAALDGSCRGS